MKSFLPYLLAFSIAALFIHCHTNTTLKTVSVKEYGFEADSGYILKKQAIDILSQADYEYYSNNDPKVKDTIDLNAADIKLTDTIGKFYKLKNGNYLACVEDIIHTDRPAVKVLTELDKSGKVLRSEGYSSGMYFCCWANKYEGFRKYGPYFSIKTCGTGSGHCSAAIYLFKEFAPQDMGIYTEIFSAWCTDINIACSYTSTIDIKDNTVTVHYTMQQIHEDDNGKTKVIKTEKFDIKYIERESKWIALDSTKIHEFPL